MKCWCWNREINKLVNYCGDREIVTTHDVSIVVASSPEDVMFTTVEAISKRQTDRSMLLLAELHRYDPKPQAVSGKLLALLARQYRMLWQAKFLSDKRVNPRDIRSLPAEITGELPTENNIAQIAFKAGIYSHFPGAIAGRKYPIHWNCFCCVTWRIRVGRLRRQAPSERIHFGIYNYSSCS